MSRSATRTCPQRREPVTVWSASRAGSTVADAAEHYERFVDASATPDTVLITLGHSSGRLLDWAQDNHVRVSVLDVRSLAPAYPTNRAVGHRLPECGRRGLTEPT